MLVDVEGEMSRESGHPYSMTSAYAPDPMEFSFTLKGSAGQCHMLDQIWFDSTRCQCQARQKVMKPQRFMPKGLVDIVRAMTFANKNLGILGQSIHVC